MRFKSAPRRLNKISINGYKVGQVREVNFNYKKPGKVEVVMALDKNLQLPEGTVADLGTTLLSGARIELTMGTGSAMIPTGGEVAAGIKGGLMSSVQDMMPAVTGVLPKVDSLLYNLNLLVADPALTASIQRLDGITDNLLSTTQGLSSTMNRQVPMLADNTVKITRSLDTIVGNLGQLSYQLKTLPIVARAACGGSEGQPGNRGGTLAADCARLPRGEHDGVAVRLDLIIRAGGVQLPGDKGGQSNLLAGTLSYLIGSLCNLGR